VLGVLELRARNKIEPRRREGHKGFIFYLIGAADQVNHHALTGNIHFIITYPLFSYMGVIFMGNIKKVTDVKADERTRRVEGFIESATPIR